MKIPILFCIVLSLLLASCRRQSETKPIAGEIAEKLDADFHRIRVEVEALAAVTAGLYARHDELVAKANPTDYRFAENGVFHKINNDGGSALWISVARTITWEAVEVAYITETLDPQFISIIQRYPEVCQAYYNDRHSVCRIYPWFDTIAQFPPSMVIPDFNFYYMADADHNPSRQGLWINEPYVDPAGRGWMISAIAPVYVGEQLEGVTGLDTTIATIVDRYLNAQDKAIAVISQGGVLVAATELAIQRLEMPPLKGHKYLETVKLDTFKPDEYNIRKSTLRPVRELAIRLLDEHLTDDQISLHGTTHTITSRQVEELDWVVVELTAAN